MANFYRFETTNIVLEFTPEGILDNYKHIIVSILQKQTKIDLTEDELNIDTSNDKITLSLTQEQTSQFEVGKALIQVNIYYNDKQRNVSTMGYINIYDNLYNKVITDE